MAQQLKSPTSSDETREKLLDAAKHVFVERGFYDATVRQICQRAGVNLALVNYHFGDKLQLYIEVFRRAMKLSRLDIFDRVNDTDTDPVTLLNELVADFLRHLKKNQTALDILSAQERARPTPAMEFIREKSTRPAYAALCVAIGRVLKLPEEHETTRLVAQSLIAQIRHFGDPERNVSPLDSSILTGKTEEELARFIISFSLSGAYPHGAASETSKGKPRSKARTTQHRKANFVEP